MYTTPGLELLLHMNLESLERAVREQHATRPVRRKKLPSLKTRVAAPLAAVRRATQATVTRHSSAVPCCA